MIVVLARDVTQEDSTRKKVSNPMVNIVVKVDDQRSSQDGRQPFAIHPRHVDPGQNVHMASGLFPSEVDTSTRDQILESTCDLLTAVYKIPGSNRAIITEVLRAALSGEDVYADSVGAFFETYGKLEQKLKIRDDDRQRKMRSSMIALLGGVNDRKHFRQYCRPNKPPDNDHPLPLYVRNILTHSGTNPLNVIGDTDIRSSIALMKSWL